MGDRRLERTIKLKFIYPYYSQVEDQGHDQIETKTSILTWTKQSDLNLTTINISFRISHYVDEKINACELWILFDGVRVIETMTPKNLFY